MAIRSQPFFHVTIVSFLIFSSLFNVSVAEVTQDGNYSPLDIDAKWVKAIGSFAVEEYNREQFKNLVKFDSLEHAGRKKVGKDEYEYALIINGFDYPPDIGQHQYSAVVLGDDIAGKKLVCDRCRFKQDNRQLEFITATSFRTTSVSIRSDVDDRKDQDKGTTTAARSSMQTSQINDREVVDCGLRHCMLQGTIVVCLLMWKAVIYNIILYRRRRKKKSPVCATLVRIRCFTGLCDAGKDSLLHWFVRHRGLVS